MENESTNTPTEEIKDDKPTVMSGLKGLGFGIVLLALAYYFFITMTAYEEGEGIRMNRILLLAYKTIGKNITTGILGLIGVFLSFSGIKEMITAGKK